MKLKIPVKNLMERSFALLAYGAPLEVAAQRLLHSRADAVLIRHDDGQLAGLLTERELVFAAQAVTEGGPNEAGHYASPRFILSAKNESFARTLSRMFAAGVRRAVVVDDDSVPIGIVSLKLNPERREDVPNFTPTYEEVSR